MYKTISVLRSQDNVIKKRLVYISVFRSYVLELIKVVVIRVKHKVCIFG